MQVEWWRKDHSGKEAAQISNLQTPSALDIRAKVDYEGMPAV